MTQRRNWGGARREATERVLLQKGDFEAVAWTLNVSRGGLRVVVEEAVCVGEEYLVQVGEQPARLARVIWLREEPDGQIAGLQFSPADDEPPSSFFSSSSGLSEPN